MAGTLPTPALAHTYPTTPAGTPHPLDPLSAAEISEAAAVCRTYAAANVPADVKLRFNVISLQVGSVGKRRGVGGGMTGLVARTGTNWKPSQQAATGAMVAGKV